MQAAASGLRRNRGHYSRNRQEGGRMITFITHIRVSPAIPKSTLLIENGKCDIKQYVSPGTEPVRRKFKP
jgi:hypothetical protein